MTDIKRQTVSHGSLSVPSPLQLSLICFYPLYLDFIHLSLYPVTRPFSEPNRPYVTLVSPRSSGLTVRSL